MAFTRALKRNGATVYLWAVAAGGFSVAAVSLLIVPDLPSAGAQPGPVVTVTVGPSAPAPSASPPSASSPGAAPVHGVPSTRVVLVGTTPSVGLPLSTTSSPPGPTVLPTPSASASGSVAPSPSPSVSPSSSTTSPAAVSLEVRVVATPTVAADVAVGLALLGVAATVTLP